MGGKTGTTKSSVSIPPEVMARYNAVNAYASDVAKTPFQGYQGQFVSGLTPTQQAGIQGTSQYAYSAQPYFQAATGQLLNAQQSALPGMSASYENVGQAQNIGSEYAGAATQGIGSALDYSQPYLGGATQAALAGAQGIQPGQLQTGQYMNPYTQAVADTTYKALRQQQEQEMSGQLGNAIRSGAFGGDRAGLVAANLARQQQLGTAQAMMPIYQQGYQQALQTAQQQQGVQLSAEQANRAAMQNLAQQLQGIGQTGYGQQMGAAQQLAALGQQQYGQGLGAAGQLASLAQQGYGMGANTAQQLAALGQGEQQAGLQGAQAQMGAGTLEQQTQQADLTARYQQFLQERGYPFQVAQFLANIAMGTGALSGSSTTTTQPMPFFSDRRVKHDVKEIGKTHDGLPLYSFKYNGDNATQIGLMAQDVEKKHPEAVGEYGGVKTVDYKKATEGAEREERYMGGIVPASMGGAVSEPGAYGRGGYSIGGPIDPNDIQALLAQQAESFGPFGESGVYGGTQHQTPFSGAKGIVPQSRLHTPRLLQAGSPPPMQEGAGSQLAKAADTFSDAKGRYDAFKKWMNERNAANDAGSAAPSESSSAPSSSPSVKTPPEKGEQSWGDWIKSLIPFNEGGAVPRMHYAVGGSSKDPSLPYEEDDKSPYKYFPTEILDTEKPELQKPNTPSSQSGSGIGELASLASLGKTLISFLPLKDGGVVPRGHYADGGDPNLDKYLDAISQIESSRNPKAIGPETQKGDRAYGLYQVMGSNIPSWTEEAVGKRMTPQEFLADEEAQRATARHHFGKALNQYGNPEDAASVWFSGRPMDKAGNASDILGTTVPDYISKFRSALGQADVPARGASTAQGVVPRKEEQTGVMPGVQNWLTENQGWLTPLGAGLKGMVQSRSPFLGGALLEGAGAGLESLGAAQRQIAETQLTKAQRDLTQMQALREGFISTPLGNFVYARNKQTGDVELITAAEYNRKKPVYEQVTGVNKQPSEAEQKEALAKEGEAPTAPGAPSAPSEAPQTPGVDEKSLVTVAPPGTRYDAQSKAAAQAAPAAADAAQYSGQPGAKALFEQGNNYFLSVNKAANASRASQPIVGEYARNLAKVADQKGFESPGFAYAYRAGAVNILDTMLRSLGVADGIGNANDTKAINDKIQSLRGNLMASQSGQESFRALEMLAHANANPDQAPDAFAPLVAMLMVQERRNIDQENHAKQWGADSGQVYYGADQDFERVNNAASYMKQVDELARTIRDAPKSFQAMTSGKYSRDEINQYFEKRGIPNMARYFLGEAG